VTECHATAHMHYYAFNLVGLRFFQTRDSQLRRVRNPIHELLMLEICLIKLESFQVRNQQLGTLLNSDLFRAHLLS
jgi:hypothetical protein